MSAEKKVLKKVGFNPAVGEERMEKIEVKDYEPFEVTFLVPGVDALFDIHNSALKSTCLGPMILDVIARHLIKWTLPLPATRHGIQQLDDDEVFSEIFNAFYAAGWQVKN